MSTKKRRKKRARDSGKRLTKKRAPSVKRRSPKRARPKVKASRPRARAVKPKKKPHAKGRRVIHRRVGKKLQRKLSHIQPRKIVVERKRRLSRPVPVKKKVTVERIRKIKPYIKVSRKKLKKPAPRITVSRKGDSKFAKTVNVQQQKVIDYIKRRRDEGAIFRFLISVKKSVRYPRGTMSTGWYNLNGYSDDQLVQFLNKFGRVKEVVTAGE